MKSAAITHPSSGAPLKSNVIAGKTGDWKCEKVQRAQAPELSRIEWSRSCSFHYSLCCFEVCWFSRWFWHFCCDLCTLPFSSCVLLQFLGCTWDLENGEAHIQPWIFFSLRLFHGVSWCFMVFHGVSLQVPTACDLAQHDPWSVIAPSRWVLCWGVGSRPFRTTPWKGRSDIRRHKRHQKGTDEIIQQGLNTELDCGFGLWIMEYDWIE